MSKIAKTLVLSVLIAGCSAEGAREAESETTAFATARTPIALDGEFRYAGHVEAVGRLTVDVVDTRSADAAERLERLRGEGAACWAVMSNTWRCSKMHPAGEVPATSIDAIGTKNQASFATFGKVWGSPSIVTEGESVVDWQIGQKGDSHAGGFNTYVYREMGDDLVKVILPAERDSVELIVKSQERLAKWDSKVVTESRWRWHEDMALVLLEKR